MLSPTHTPTPSAPTTNSSIISITEADADTTDFSCPHCRRASTPHIGLVGHLRIHHTETGKPVPEAPTYIRCTRLYSPNCIHTFIHRMGLFGCGGVTSDGHGNFTPLANALRSEPGVTACLGAASAVPSTCAFPASGLLNYVLPPGPGGEGGWNAVDAVQVYSHYKPCASHRPCSQPAVEHMVDIVGIDRRIIGYCCPTSSACRNYPRVRTSAVWRSPTRLSNRPVRSKGESDVTGLRLFDAIPDSHFGRCSRDGGPALARLSTSNPSSSCSAKSVKSPQLAFNFLFSYLKLGLKVAVARVSLMA
ncbi:hypothetical protein SprV_0301112700 [Sparganum proliferum]